MQWYNPLGEHCIYIYIYQSPSSCDNLTQPFYKWIRPQISYQVLEIAITIVEIKDVGI